MIIIIRYSNMYIKVILCTFLKRYYFYSNFYYYLFFLMYYFLYFSLLPALRRSLSLTDLVPSLLAASLLSPNPHP